MRFTLLGIVVCLLAVAAGLTAWAQPGQPLGQPPAGQAVGPGISSSSGFDEQTGLIALTTTAGENRQQVTVIDPREQVMSVYHIELSTGVIELMCVRKIHWDLRMVQFNGTSPLPQEIRAKLEHTR